MKTTTETMTISNTALWIGRVLAGLFTLFMVFDAVVKLLQLPQAVEPTVQLGWAATALPAIGALSLMCLVLFLIPRTSIIGAVLMTGYLGGALASNWRAGTPAFNIIFPIIIGALMWGSLLLRHPLVRAAVSSRGSFKM